MSSSEKYLLVDELNTNDIRQLNGVKNVYDKILNPVLSKDAISGVERGNPFVTINPYQKALVIAVNFIILDKLKPQTHRKYLYTKSDYDAINCKLLEIDWTSEFNSKPLEDAVDFFFTVIYKLALKQSMCTKSNEESNPREKRYENYITSSVFMEDDVLAPRNDLTYSPDDMSAMIADENYITKESPASSIDYTLQKTRESNNDVTRVSEKRRRVTKSPDVQKENNFQPGNTIYKKTNIAKSHKEKRKKKERKFYLYEIKNADVWTDVHVQLFEKLMTPDGNTVWNDLTGESFLVNSLVPEWNGDSISVRYRQAEWVPKEHFFLPTESLCLVVPQRDAGMNENEEFNSFDDHMVVPMEDIIYRKVENREVTHTGVTELPEDQGSNNEGSSNRELRHVNVRVSRAIWVGSKEHYNLTSHGGDKYLTLPHQRVYRSQLEVEARADDNQLVRVGASGRIPLVVTDNSRKTRAIITVQATNTGLAAARFRITTRDCGPELESDSNERNKHEIVGDPIIIPPMHSQRVHLEIPFETPAETAQCTVAMLNDGDDAVAVREVPIKKEDRCFCVWHCECVCLGDDPKLLCKDMSESRQVAAGLAPKDRARHVRSACYKDSETLDVAVAALGVLYVLLILGLFKALLGICCRCFGSWGLDKIVQTPRRLDRYYEAQLAGRTVRYDADGWPVHPDTGERTVRLISGTMEFFLNILFFIIWPFTALYCAYVLATCDSNCDGRKCVGLNATTKCFSSHDMHGSHPRWRKRRVMESRKWMTPEAEWLSEDIWSKGLGIYPGRHDDSCTKPPQPKTPEQQLSDLLLPLLRPRPKKSISQPWMSPEAQGISGDIWLKPPKDPHKDKDKTECEKRKMRRLTSDDYIAKSDILCNSSLESVMDDTQFVVMQMQKSRDSLARSQKLINGSAVSINNAN